MLKSLRESSLSLDDTHSFILRINFNRSPGQGGKTYPYFQLEHVNEHSRSNFKSLVEVCESLTSQVERMLAKFDLIDRSKLDD
jgi:hypothetical protein